MVIKMPHNQSYTNYTREFKLEVVNYYRTSNFNQTNKRYKLANAKLILKWVAQSLVKLIADELEIKGGDVAQARRKAIKERRDYHGLNTGGLREKQSC